MGRVKNPEPGLHEYGYLTARAMVANLRHLVRAHVLPALPPEASREGSRILDVGCGKQPYRALFGDWRFVGINLDRDDAQPDVQADGLRLPFRDDSFPAAICTQVIEHVTSPGRLLGEIHRCLKPGGVLVLSGPMYWPLHEEPHDYWRFTRHGMRLLFEQAGLEVLEIRDDGNAIALTATSINHLMQGRWWAPARILVNLAGRLAQPFFDRTHSTPNLTVAARKRPLSA
jgi:SAM-dependent methyltransferase